MSFDAITYALLKGKTSSLQNEIDILKGDAQTEDSVDNKIAEAISDSPEEYEKLQQLQEWLDEHSDMEAALIDDVTDLKDNKQDKLIEGQYITIDDNVIDVKVDNQLDSSSTNPISNNVVADLAENLEAVKTMIRTTEETANEAKTLAVNASSNANQAIQQVNNKQDKLIAGENITIVNNVISASGGGGGTSEDVEITQAEYNALTPAQKNNGNNYFITDASANPLQPGTSISIHEDTISVISDSELLGNSINPVQNKVITETINNLSQKDNEQDAAIAEATTAVAALGQEINTIQNNLSNKQDTIINSDNIVIDNNIIDLSDNVKTYLNNITNTLEQQSSDINEIDNTLETAITSIGDVEKDINDLEITVTQNYNNLSGRIDDIDTNKQNKLTAGSGIEINAEGVISAPNAKNYAPGSNIYFRERNNEVQICNGITIMYHSPETASIPTGDMYQHTNASDIGQRFNPYTEANAVGYNSTSTVQEALDNLIVDNEHLNNLVGIQTTAIQNLQTTAQSIDNKVNNLNNAFNGLSSVYLPKQNPQYNGTFSSTGNYAIGANSFALGFNSTAIGIGSYANGKQTYAANDYAYAIGDNTTASGQYSYAEGSETQSNGQSSHAEGLNTTAEGAQSHTEGFNTSDNIAASFSHIEGALNHINLSSPSSAIHIEGMNCITGATARGDLIASHIEGYDNGILAEDKDPATQMYGSTAMHIEGYGNWGHKGVAQHIEGEYCYGSGHAAHVEGYSSKAYGGVSIPAHAEGDNTTADSSLGTESGHTHTEGVQTYACLSPSYKTAHAEGYATSAIGNNTHSAGDHTIANVTAQTVVGKYNSTVDNTLFIVGNGTEENRSNAFIVKENGETEANDYAVTIEDTKYTLTQIISALKTAGILS